MHLKSERDLVYLRRSADLVSRTLGEVARHVRPGVTTRELDEIAEAFIRDNGGRPAFKGYDPGWGGGRFPGSLCVSVNDVVVHGFPSDYALEEGDLLAVDCGVELDGYFGDCAYTFAVGEVSDEKRHLCRTTFDALHRGIEQVRHGQRIGDVAFAVQQHCEANGCGVVRDLVGHGIGMELHESPSVPNYGKRGSGAKIKAGLTICIEPMVNLGTYRVSTDSDKWTVRTEDGSPSAHYEHMVLARKGEAPEVLTTYRYIETHIEAPYHEVLHGETASH